MSLSENFARATKMFRVAPGESSNLDTRDPAWAGDEDRSEKKRKKHSQVFSWLFVCFYMTHNGTQTIR